ncbi:HelD family protein [Luteimicrobium subarcticum]|uniref:DNA helicase IV n=1 Tax=Luteimicrobium subarcticum TaxID=620910 RepID=A0A2M8WW21_9MICO|nr:UvrD-helicase domain-containing protein [Luteimicrobium subarcticum]PJI95124.1 DNA helicase IV [Luteimicrobium subarcticum]
MAPVPDTTATLEDEQRFFDHAREVREKARAQLAQAVSAAADNKARASLKKAAASDETHGSPQDPAAFLRIDTKDGECFYVGNAGVRDETSTPLVYSWKARYIAQLRAATHTAPGDVVRNRTYTTEPVNRVLRFDDVVLADLAERVAALDDPQLAVIEDDALLLDALDRERSPDMRQIVQTIQAAQSEIVGAEAAQLLVVQGGPGTGKTAVALHRASSLLFNEQIDADQLLVVGPNPTFTRYIASVLPELGDRHVRQTDVTRMLDVTVTATAHDDPAAARLKGDARMVGLLAKGLRDRVRTLDDALSFSVRTMPWRVRIAPDDVAEIAARYVGSPYAIGRVRFREALTAALASAVKKQAQDDGDRVPGDTATLLHPSELENAVERVWPQLSSQAYLRDLFGSLERLVAAAEGASISADELQLLRRPAAARLADQSWSREDLVLLDHVNAAINGDLPGYQHVVVDEAQDLSPMQLLSIRRRSVDGAMTVVGDIAQSTGLWARDTWDDVVDVLRSALPVRLVELEYGYRVPRSVMALAARLLPVAAPGLHVPTVVRDVEPGPQLVPVPTGAASLAATVRTAVTHHSARGRFVGLVCPDGRRAEVVAALDADDIQWHDADSGSLDKAINVVSPVGAKGLEFDAVVVVDPQAIVDAGPRGERMLYIALTRTTKFLDVVHPEGALPTLLGGTRAPVDPPAPVAPVAPVVEPVRPVPDPAVVAPDSAVVSPDPAVAPGPAGLALTAMQRKMIDLVVDELEAPTLEVLSSSFLPRELWPVVLEGVAERLREL